MGLKILCSGYLIRHPRGGFVWHHFQYLLGLRRMGCEVVYFEDYGWPKSCFDVSGGVMTDDPGYGINSLRGLFQAYDLQVQWCYLASDGAAHGMTREQLAQSCAECDLYVDLSGLNWVDELEHCRRRVLVDTDPVFTQIGAHGLGVPFSRYQALFTYGENVHRPGCDMPTGGGRWLPTRQPVVLDLWGAEAGGQSGAFTTVTNWEPLGDKSHGGRTFGGKAREFEPYFSLPREARAEMEIALNCEPKLCDPRAVRGRLAGGGWRIADHEAVSRTPWSYRDYLRASLAEFSVAKHGYVVTRCGWFSERSAAYMALGRPVVVQDTGFGRSLPCGEGLLPFRNREGAASAIREVCSDYEAHGKAARRMAEEFFDSRLVLTDLLERSL